MGKGISIAARRQKGRALQVMTAEAFAVTLGLTIEAAYPTMPGKRTSGAEYVGEGRGADLRVRASGQPGLDVVPLSPKAANSMRLFDRPLAIECKFYADSEWGKEIWWKNGQPPGCVAEGVKQTRNSLRDWTKSSVLVVNKSNNIIPIASFYTEDIGEAQILARVYSQCDCTFSFGQFDVGYLVVASLDSFVESFQTISSEDQRL